MYHAKQAGRNRVAFAPPLRDMGVGDMGMGAMDAAAAIGSEHLPVGGTPLSGHRVVLVHGGPGNRFFMPSKVTLRVH